MPSLVEPEIIGINVFEVQAAGTSSQIGPDKSIFVAEIPDSERAPHQSTRDKRYYVRIGGSSQPASHRLIEDIRNRLKYPLVVVEGADLTPTIPHLSSSNFSVKGRLEIRTDLRIRNIGKIKASDVCVSLTGHNADLSFGLVDSAIAQRRPSLSHGGFGFWELQHPIYPEFDTDLRIACSTEVELVYYVPNQEAEWKVTSSGSPIDDAGISWTIYADHAPPSISIVSFGSKSFSRTLAQETYSCNLREGFRQHFNPRRSYG